jgi:hypothetical protein
MFFMFQALKLNAKHNLGIKLNAQAIAYCLGFKLIA